ncbi:quinon protein alcohol dehydrogenase-like superfamily [Pelagophyceae sp. CCMP2097]|nr:quinon protein alcohol dehydrogenase-like superfamily [Pelagophyceae sp. CCMP2097]
MRAAVAGLALLGVGDGFVARPGEARATRAHSRRIRKREENNGPCASSKGGKESQDDASPADEQLEGVPESLTSLLPLYERIAKSRAAEEDLDRQLSKNWRTGKMGELAVVELDDTRVSFARLDGETCAFGTATGIVVVVDLNDGVVLDGFDGHDGDVTALAWDGEMLISGGVDSVVRVYRPRGEGKVLFEELEDLDDLDSFFDDIGDVGHFWASVDLDDDFENLGLLALLEPGTFDLESETAGPNGGAMARAPLYGGFGADWASQRKPRPELIIAVNRQRDGPFALLPSEADLADDDDDDDDEIALFGHTERITGVHRCGEFAVMSCSLDGRLTKWDIRTQIPTVLATLPSAICAMSVADGVAVVGSLDGRVAAFDIESGRLVFELKHAHAAAVRSLHFQGMGRGQLLATGGADGVIKLWTLQDEAVSPKKRGKKETNRLTPQQPSRARNSPPRLQQPGESDVEAHREQKCRAHRFVGHRGAVTALQADDSKLVSASIDGTLRVWCLKTGEELYSIGGRSAHVASLQFDKNLLVSDGTDSALVVHDFSPGAPKAPPKADYD